MDYSPKKGITIQTQRGKTIPQIILGENRKFYVDEKEVALDSPSQPLGLSVILNPDASQATEDFFPPRRALEGIVSQYLEKYPQEAKKSRGFIIWGSQRIQESEHLIERDDYIQTGDTHTALIQFFRYKPKN